MDAGGKYVRMCAVYSAEYQLIRYEHKTGIDVCWCRADVELRHHWEERND